MSLPFTKMQGVGNDFVMVEGRVAGAMDWSALAPELCDRRTGIGADGLIVMESSAIADVLMRMYNPDGTPDVCGNGLRCVARYAVERGLVPTESLTVATLAGVRTAQLHRTPDNAVAVTVSMGQPHLEASRIPMCLHSPRVVSYPLPLEGGTLLPITALSTGSAHAVTFVESLPDDDHFTRISPQVEHHPLFPERISLMWCRVASASRLELRIWERGAGETWGCGTGACAAAVAAILAGYIPPNTEITVASRGGELRIRWQENLPMEMTGPAEFVYDGVYLI